jgi:dolichyl-phosphate beta-glucosyltransferase
MTPDAALIIPCFNERGRAEPFLRELLDTCPDTLVVTVDDGSSAPLGPSNHPRWICLGYETNRGKGHAVRFGWNWILEHQPAMEFLGFGDADGAVSVSEIARLLAIFRQSSSGLLIGSRVRMLGRHVHRQAIRHYTGRIYATLASLLLDLPSYDTQCGCKWIRRPVWEDVAGDLIIDRFAFDAELIVRVCRKGHAVVEQPVDWEEKSGSRVRLFRDSWNMGRDLWELRRSLHGS